MAGYSGTPLVKKLGIKSGFNIAFVNAPEGFSKALDLPVEVKINSQARQPIDFGMLFVTSVKQLRIVFPMYSAKLKPAGMLWVAWPKKSSGVVSDLSETIVQSIGLAEGMVDTKVCAVDEVWSGLKFVFRLKDRPKRST
jgi:hypothetical protein